MKTPLVIIATMTNKSTIRMAVLVNAIIELNENMLNKLLLESHFENELSIDQTYQVLEELKSQNIQALFDVKAAFLPTLSQYEFFTLYADALKSQNILAKAFKDKTSALAWLQINI